MAVFEISKKTLKIKMSFWKNLNLFCVFNFRLYFIKNMSNNITTFFWNVYIILMFRFSIFLV